MKDTAAAAPSDERRPLLDDYIAAGHDQGTADALVGMDRMCAANRAAVEALKDHPDAYNGWALQNQLAGKRFEASPKRKAKVTAWMEARERGENVALDLSAELEQAERWACAEVSRRRGASAGYQLVRRPGATFVLGARMSSRQGGRSARPATNDRHRGSRRSSARRSSERSGDSGSEDGESEPPERRLCQLSDCDRGLPSGRRKFCCVQHADLARKRNERRRDRANPERVADRGYALAVKRALATGVPRHILCTHEEHRGFELHSPDDDVFCGLCGRWVGAPTASVNGYDAAKREMERLDERAAGERRHKSWQLPRRRRPRPFPDRTYTDPSIVMAAKLRHTREDREVAA